MRVLLGGGGSGGHVFPALAVASRLREQISEDLDVLYVGTEQGVEAGLAREANVPFASVSARPVRGRNAVSQVWSVLAILQGVRDAVQIIRRYRPNSALVTGGYVSVPVGIAAKLTRTPLVLFQPDIEPGWAVRLLAHLATRVCVTDARSLQRAPGRKSTATGYPLRPVFDDLDRPMARARFQFNGGPAVLIAGAVQGARRINDCIDRDLEAWLEVAQVIHVTGPVDAQRMRARRDALPTVLQSRYQVFEYLGNELPIAMAACDLAVSRAGASVLGEYPAAQLPAVLVPLPAAGGHQRRNAEVLENSGAAVIVEDSDVPTQLLPVAQELLRDTNRLESMRRQAAAKARPDATRKIAEVVWEVRR